MSLQLSESYGLRRRAPSRPATPLPDLTILPHEPIHQLKGEFPPYVIRVRPSARAEKQLNAASICQVFCFPTWYSPLILRSSWMEQISPLESCSSILPISRRQHVNGAENFTGFHQQSADYTWKVAEGAKARTCPKQKNRILQKTKRTRS